MLSNILLSVVKLCIVYTERHNCVECHYAECRYAECRGIAKKCQHRFYKNAF